MRIKNVVLLIVFCIGFSYVYSQDEIDSSELPVIEEKSTPRWGFIFNTNNLLLDIESYQAGVGIKTLNHNNVAIRYLGDIFYSSSSNTFSGTLGATYEKHFKPGRLSPYWGGFIEAGYIGQKSEVDSDNWTKNNSFPVSLGAVLGTEFFILEFLSVFAEYSLYLDSTITSTSTSTAGVVVKTDPELNFSIDSGIGNNSSLGIVIYLDDIIDLEKKAEDETKEPE